MKQRALKITVWYFLLHGIVLLLHLQGLEKLFHYMANSVVLQASSFSLKQKIFLFYKEVLIRFANAVTALASADL